MSRPNPAILAIDRHIADLINTQMAAAAQAKTIGEQIEAMRAVREQAATAVRKRGKAKAATKVSEASQEPVA